MTKVIETLSDVAHLYDAIVFDQWGVLHDGTSPYVGTINAIHQLAQAGPKLGVLSNSGKRAALNKDRIAGMGFDTSLFDCVMTSGEALWRDVDAGRISGRAVFPISGDPADEQAWGHGLGLTFIDDITHADWVLLMGRPVFDGDAAAETQWYDTLAHGITEHRLKVICTNPDRKSPRAGGKLVPSPGAIAHDWATRGMNVTFYGKPHRPVFDALETALGAGRYLMVGDSLEHDIAGAQSAGWDSLLIQGGLYADKFAQNDSYETLMALVNAQGCQPPTFRIKEVR